MKRFSALLCFLLLAGPALAQRDRSRDWGVGVTEKKQKVGVWEYFAPTHSGGRVLVQRYDHDAHKLLYFQNSGDDLVLVETQPNDWRMCRVQQPPLFLGGNGVLSSYLRDVVYPENAQANNVQGCVRVAIVVDTLGQVRSLKVRQGIGAGCDEEALRVARTIPQTWIPARIGSRAVVSEFELPVTFRLAPR